MSDTTDVDVSMLIAAHARLGDPLTRFVEALPPELRVNAEETVRLRAELVDNVQRLLQSRDPRESSRYAAWIATWVGEVGYRWSSLLCSAARWHELQAGYVRTRVPTRP